jgi:hypothetical protein
VRGLSREVASVWRDRELGAASVVLTGFTTKLVRGLERSGLKHKKYKDTFPLASRYAPHVDLGSTICWKRFHRVERSYGTFVRSFALPEDTTGENIKAEFKEGMLYVHVPKSEKARPKAIEVKVD